MNMNFGTCYQSSLPWYTICLGIPVHKITFVCDGQLCNRWWTPKKKEHKIQKCYARKMIFCRNFYLIQKEKPVILTIFSYFFLSNELKRTNYYVQCFMWGFSSESRTYYIHVCHCNWSGIVSHYKCFDYHFQKKIYSFRILMQCINYSETHSEREGVYNWKTRTILHELIHWNIFKIHKWRQNLKNYSTTWSYMECVHPPRYANEWDRKCLCKIYDVWKWHHLRKFVGACERARDMCVSKVWFFFLR